MPSIPTGGYGGARACCREDRLCAAQSRPLRACPQLGGVGMARGSRCAFRRSPSVAKRCTACTRSPNPASDCKPCDAFSFRFVRGALWLRCGNADLSGPACSSRRPAHLPASSFLLFWGCLSSSGASSGGVSAGQKIASALAYLTGRPKTTVTVKRGAPEGPGAGPRNAWAGVFPEITMRTREVARKGRAISAQAGW